jgi:hypothetical protein
LSARVPTGQFVTRQPAAAVVEAEDIARQTARGRRLRRRRR